MSLLSQLMDNITVSPPLSFVLTMPSFSKYFLRNVAAFFHDVFLKVYCSNPSGKYGFKCDETSVEDNRGNEMEF